MNIARKSSRKYFSRFAFARAARNSTQHIFRAWSMANASISDRGLRPPAGRTQARIAGCARVPASCPRTIP